MKVGIRGSRVSGIPPQGKHGGKAINMGSKESQSPKGSSSNWPNHPPPRHHTRTGSLSLVYRSGQPPLVCFSVGTGPPSTLPWPRLPVDPLLSSSRPDDPAAETGSTSVAAGLEPTGISLLPPFTPPTHQPSVLVTEGLPPIPTRLLDRIRKWESTLLGDRGNSQQVLSLTQSGQVLILGSNQATNKSKGILDIFSWLRAFSIYMAALVSADTTTRVEAAGLAAHLHLILQIAKDLGGGQWLEYDQSFREWAAARGLRKWGELNFSIYGRCLAHSQKITEQTPVSQGSSTMAGRSGSATQKLKRTDRNYCFKWNESGICNRSPCRFTHTCSNCGGNHRVVSCPYGPHRKM